MIQYNLALIFEDSQRRWEARETILKAERGFRALGMWEEARECQAKRQRLESPPSRDPLP